MILNSQVLKAENLLKENKLKEIVLTKESKKLCIKVIEYYKKDKIMATDELNEFYKLPNYE